MAKDVNYDEINLINERLDSEKRILSLRKQFNIG